MAVADKSPKPWIVDYVAKVIEELGYGGIEISIKCDAALIFGVAAVYICQEVFPDSTE